MLENLFGLTGSIISFVMWLPQARTTWTNRYNPTALAGISVGTQYLVLVAAVLWGAYALVTGAYWSGASGVVTAPLALATIGVLRRAGRAELPALVGAEPTVMARTLVPA